jgi:hypothetical protein
MPKVLPAFLLLLSGVCLLAQTQPAAATIPHEDEVRLAELYSLAPKYEDSVWPGWSEAPFSILLVTPQTEFVIHRAEKPEGFEKIADSELLHSAVYARPRQFPKGLLATFPAFGDRIPVIVIGEAQLTEAKTSTPWLITLMHEHFHQLQETQPGAYENVDKLGLSKGDNTGMWMLNYAFPYDSKDLNDSFDHLKTLLLGALNEPDAKKFKPLAEDYVRTRKDFMAKLTPDDHKYLALQLWKEGIARYTEIKFAEAAAAYQPSADYKGLPDYSDFASYPAKRKAATLDELSKANLAKWQRIVVYSFGACEGLFLDRWHPQWQQRYFKETLSTDSYF